MSRKRNLKVKELRRRNADKSNATQIIMTSFLLKGKRSEAKMNSAVNLYLNGKNKF